MNTSNRPDSFDEYASQGLTLGDIDGDGDLDVAEGNDFLTVRSIKRQIDGALGAHGAWLLEPYEDLPDSAGLVLETVEDIEGTAEIAVRHGFQVNTHAIGDRAVRETLDIYERIFDRTGVDGRELRWRVGHAQHIDPVDVPRFGGMGVIASVQAVHGTSDGPWIPSRLGDARAKSTSQPWRHLFETGAVVTNGTDVPVERIDPIASYYSSVSRMMVNGERFYPEHVMTREEAMITYTVNNAYAAFEENIKGRLVPGLPGRFRRGQDLSCCCRPAAPPRRFAPDVRHH